MTHPLRRVAVYCGSSNNVPATYRLAAAALGRGLAERGIGVVYGGGDVGLMGETARAALAAGGEVIGVITEGLTGQGIVHQIGLGALVDGYAACHTQYLPFCF